MVKKGMKEGKVTRWNWSAIGVMFVVFFVSLASIAQPEAKKGTSDIQLRASCVDAECHANYKESKYVHSPVILKACNG